MIRGRRGMGLGIWFELSFGEGNERCEFLMRGWW